MIDGIARHLALVLVVGLLLLSACGGGPSQSELDEVQNQLKEARRSIEDLQSQLGTAQQAEVATAGELAEAEQERDDALAQATATEDALAGAEAA
ncbi:MAG: hypothetical protein ACE5KX_01350, partial [Acidimicrobiia bacterium]